MALYLGIDTSNYRTSVAVFNPQSSEYKNSGRILDVDDGKIGLRQSEALFQHVLWLPKMTEGLETGLGKNLSAIGVSTRPRAVDGSYMPCFHAGASLAHSMAHIMGIQCFEFSHQQGHITAAAFSAGKLDLLQNSFLAWHLSGGTTELLKVTPDKENIIMAEKIGGTTDLAAGQIIDRAGKLLNLKFPSGVYLEELSQTCEKTQSFKPKVTDCEFSLSGVENKINDLVKNGADNDYIAKFTIETITNAVSKATEQAMKKYKLPILCSGGVMANKFIQNHMKNKFGAFFATPELSGDNGVGVAILSAIKSGEIYE